MLALQVVIGVGIAMLFPLLIYTGVAVVKASRGLVYRARQNKNGAEGPVLIAKTSLQMRDL